MVCMVGSFKSRRQDAVYSQPWNTSPLKSQLAIRHGTRIIRPALVPVCLLVSLRLLFDL
jgi:hypothetical protein